MSASSSTPRAELLNNAVLFLRDPKVRSSTLQSKIEFLHGKGLTDEEVQEALGRAAGAEGWVEAGPSSGLSRGGAGAWGERALAPEVPRRDWRDWFIMAVVSGGVAYGLSALAKKYLMPHLQPPSSTSFQQTSSALTEQFDEAQRLLNELQAQTTTLQSSIESDRERVGSVVEEVEQALQSVRDGEEKWREEMRDVRSEVESVRDLVPKMIEKHAAGQTAALADLQNELRSLKTLLQNRQRLLDSPTAATGANGNGNGNGTGSGESESKRAADALLGAKRGIPAWQLAGPPSSSASASGKSEEGEAKESG